MKYFQYYIYYIVWHLNWFNLDLGSSIMAIWVVVSLLCWCNLFLFTESKYIFIESISFSHCKSQWINAQRLHNKRYLFLSSKIRTKRVVPFIPISLCKEIRLIDIRIFFLRSFEVLFCSDNHCRHELFRINLQFWFFHSLVEHYNNSHFFESWKIFTNYNHNSIKVNNHKQAESRNVCKLFLNRREQDLVPEPFFFVYLEIHTLLMGISNG